MKKFRQILSLFLVIAMLSGMMVFPVSAEETVLPITGGETISADGTYQLASDATGVITVAEGVQNVTIVGNGAEWDEDPNSTTHGAVYSAPNMNVGIDCTAAPGITLTLRDAYISNSGIAHNSIDFLGVGNTLIFDGTVILDHDNGANGYASIHVPTGSDLTIYGTSGSRGYFYKSEQAAGIGGDYYEACGEITFGLEGEPNDFYFFMKGSKQGAVIGNGANCSDIPGNITFNSGIYNLLGVARGAIISGSAGAASQGAGNVFVNGGLINMNVDFSGAAIGGGGYAEGNDKAGGLLYVSGGSVRTYIDSNAVSSWGAYDVTECGVNDAAITAGRVNAAGEDVYLLNVDTTGAEADAYTIEVDGEVYYEGPRYSYSYYLEDQNRDTDGDGSADLATTPSGTPGNWVVMDEPCFYLYVTGEDHTVTVNGADTTYYWDAEEKTFSLTPIEEKVPAEHTVTLTVDATQVVNQGGTAIVPVTLSCTEEFAALGVTKVEMKFAYDMVGVSNCDYFVSDYGTCSSDWSTMVRTLTLSEDAVLSDGMELLSILALGKSSYGGVADGLYNVSVSSVVFYVGDTALTEEQVDVEVVAGGITMDNSYYPTIDVVDDTGYGFIHVVDEVLNPGSAPYGSTLVCSASNVPEGYALAGVKYVYPEASYGSVAYEQKAIRNTEGTVRVTMPRSDVTLYPYYEALYTVTVDAEQTTNGTVVSPVESFVSGQYIQFTCTADDGYDMGTLYYAYVDPDSGETVTKTTTSTGITMPAADVTVWVEFARKIPVEYQGEHAKFYESTTAVKAGRDVDTYPVADEGYFISSVEYSIDGGETWTAATSYYWSTKTITTDDGRTVSAMLYRFSMPECESVLVRANAYKYNTYTVDETIEHGTVKLGSSDSDMSYDAVTGSKVYVSAAAEDGYELSSVWATYVDADGNTQDATVTDYREYTWTAADFYVSAPNESADGYTVTVYATFTKIPVTYAWYEAGAESGSYTISTAEELAQMAAIVNGTDENYAQDTFLGKTVTLAGDIDLSTICSAELGTWNAIGGVAETVTLSITSQEELDAALYEYNIIYDDTGWSYKYGTDKNLPYDANRTYYIVQGQIFSGTFDGAGYTIENLYVLSTTGYAGLFGNVDGTLKDFTVKGTVTTATDAVECDFVGGVTGKLSEGGRIEGVTSYVDVDAQDKCYNVGGIAGFNGTKNATADNAFSSAENTVIVECVNYGSVYGWSQVGGIAGENAGQILRCANYGYVDALKSGSKAGIGGIAGRNGCNNVAYTAGTIIDCFNFGDIADATNKWVGGIAGFNNAASLIQNCYNIGEVDGAGQTNAICGQNEGVASSGTGVYNCWYLDTITGFDASGVYGGAYADCGAKSEAEMKDPVFAAILGENFNVDSELINEGYPVLDWMGGTAAPALYTVTMPESDELFVVSYTESTTVAEGGSFSFKVYVTDGYTINYVKANDTALTAVSGVYTIENITSDVTVEISVSKIYISTWYTTVGTDFIIDTADELVEFAQIVNGTHEYLAQDSFEGKTVTLAADIVLAEDGLYTVIEDVTYGTSSWPMTVDQYVISADAPVWTPIGSGTASGNTVSDTANAFAGIFDGAGYTVSGVYTGTTDVAAANTDGVQGLFGIVTGTVKNVTVSGCVTGNSVVGGVAAYLYGGTVENCVNNAIVFSDGGTTPNGGVENGTSRAGATGGIVGLAAGTGSVTGCANNAAVICANTNKGGRVGGIVGLIDQSADAISISRCVNNGTVDGYQYVGGIIGMNYAKNSPIDSCANNGRITFHSGGKSHAGGIVGQFDCIVSNCYNTGDIYAANAVSQEPKYFGGVAGDYVYNVGNGKVINCYTTGTVTYAQSTCSYAGIVLGDGPQSNCYYLDTALANSGSGVVTDINTATKLTAAELKSAATVALLGDAWQANCGGDPVLTWQEANVHTAGTAVVENLVEATCTSDGSYDEVVYCTTCAAELSRNTVVTSATGHSFDDNKQCANCGAVTGWSGDLTWILDNGTLTFSGEGKMKNYTWKSATPWYDYREDVTTVILPEGVTRISGYAFYGMTNLTDIVIPSTVTVIGDYAFKNCASLTEIVLPEGLTAIGDSAFYGTGLTSVAVPASVSVINEYAFKGCAALTTVTLNEGLTVIGEAAFYACPALTEIVLPSTVTEIGGYAFKNCTALASVTLNEGLETIGASAFYGCSALTEIVIPASVASIEEYAFAHCTALATIDIQGEPVIGEYAFKNVPGFNG